MKYLQDYMSERQTIALEKAGAFFAFSKAQYEEKAQPNTTYVNGPAGMICRKDSIDTLIEELKTIYEESIQQDIQENGLNAIIRRELNNHEAYYTDDIESTAEALKDYPVTDDDILAVYRNKNHVLEVVTS
jgi:hypothetical protein